MPAKSTFLSNTMLDLLLGRTAYTAPATLYVALFTAAPTAAGGGTEVAGGSYSRIAVTNDATSFPAAAAGAKTNAVPVTFAQATGAWGTITHVGIFDALAAGQLLFFAPLAAPQTVATGGRIEFGLGDMAFSEV